MTEDIITCIVSVKTTKHFMYEKVPFSKFWIRFNFMLLSLLVTKLVKFTVGMTNLADGQNLFEMIICLRGLAMIWLKEIYAQQIQLNYKQIKAF